MGNTNNNPAETDNGEAKPETLDFIREIVANDLASGKHASTVTRFPPEPNGYLHLGHAKRSFPFGINHRRYVLTYSVVVRSGNDCQLAC